MPIYLYISVVGPYMEEQPHCVGRGLTTIGHIYVADGVRAVCQKVHISHPVSFPFKVNKAVDDAPGVGIGVLASLRSAACPDDSQSLAHSADLVKEDLSLYLLVMVEREVRGELA